MRSISAISLAVTAACLLGGAAPAPEGYLTPEQRPDLAKIQLEPPAPGSARAEADARIFRESCLAGASIFVAEMNSPGFRADLEAARAEMAALRGKSRPEPTGCAG